MKPGRFCTGYRPKTGNPVDDKGNLVLVYQYGKPPRQEASSPASDARDIGRKVRRQGLLL